MSFTLCLANKRQGRSLAAACVTGLPNPGRLFHIFDRYSNSRFLVDTGAEVSVLPPSLAERSSRQGNFTLKVVNGSEIATFGARSITVTSYHSMGVHYCRRQAIGYRCRFPASLWSNRGHATPYSLRFHH